MKNVSFVSARALATALALALPTMAMAAEDDAADAADASADAAEQVSEGDTIIVTGTRSLGISAADSPAPVQVLGIDTLKRVGQTDLMQALGQNLPSVQVQAFGNDQTAMHPSIKLRGLNPNHTLVLINGKRRHGTANVVVTNALWTGGAAPDIGLIPQDGISRIEVLQGGAAALYGTDAIAGVINIILKDNDSGGSVNAVSGEYFDGGGFTWDLMGNIGIEPIPDMYLSVTAQRKFHDYSFRGDVDPRVVDTGQSTSANTGNNGGRTILARYPGVRTFDHYPYVNRIFGDGRMDLTNLMYNWGYTGIPDVEIYSFGTYSRRVGSTYQNYRLPNVVYGRSASPNIAVPTGDIPFPAGFSPREVLRETDFAATGGVKGTFGDTTIDASLTFGRDFNGIYVEDSANAALYYDSSSATQVGYSPSDVHDGDFIASQLTGTVDLTHEIDLGLYEPVGFAVGGEYRRETYDLRAGEPASYYVGSGTLQGGIQSFFGYAPANASHNLRHSYAGYADVSLTPLEGVFFEGAARYERYSDFGDTTIFRGTARWDISPAFAVRGTASTGFRAPTLAEAFYSGINVSVSSLSGIFAPNSPGAGALGIGGLGPEKSTSFSGGVVFRPIDDLSVTLDAYSIYLRDRIVQSAGFTGYSNNCRYLPAGYTAGMDVTAAYNAFTAGGGTCTGFISPSVIDALNANGVPIIPVIQAINGGASGSLNINTFVNGLDTLTRGVDFVASYDGFDLVGGTLSLSLSANYNDTKVKDIGTPPPNVNQSQGLFDKYSQSAIAETSPKWRGVASAFWELDGLSISLRESVYGKSRLLASTPANANIDYFQVIGTKFVTDVELAYQAVPGFKIAIGANNLFNVYPEELPGYIRDQQYALSSTAYVSRYPSFSPVGINGGYYYGRVSLDF